MSNVAVKEREHRTEPRRVRQMDEWDEWVALITVLKLISELALYVLCTCAVRALALRSQSKGHTGGWTQRVTVTTWQRKKRVIILYVNCPLSTLLFRSALGRDSSVGIATRYGLDGPEIESRWGQDFQHLYWLALGPTQSPIQWVPGLFLGLMRPERGVDHPLHLLQRLQKEYSYTSTPPLGFRGLF